MPDAKQRTHTELLHGLVIEDIHLDAELRQLLGAFGETFGIEDVRRFVDEAARERHSFGKSRPLLPRRLCLCGISNGDHDIHRTLALALILFLGTVNVETVGPELHSERRFGRRDSPVVRRVGQVEQHSCADTAAELAHESAAEADMVRQGVLDRILLRPLAGAEHEQPVEAEPLWSQDVECAAVLSLEIRGGGRALVASNGVAENLAGLRRDGEAVSGERDQDRGLTLTRWLRTRRDGIERDKLDRDRRGHPLNLAVGGWSRRWRKGEIVHYRAPLWGSNASAQG